MVDGAVLLLEKFTRRWKTQQLRVKAAHDGRDVFLDDEARFFDRLRVLITEADEFCHVVEITTGINSARAPTLFITADSAAPMPAMMPM